MDQILSLVEERDIQEQKSKSLHEVPAISAAKIISYLPSKIT